MIHAIFYSGLGILLTGWESPALRIIFMVEIITSVIGILFGLLSAPKQIPKIILAIIFGIGLLLILKNVFFGLESDAFILIPFIGEILSVSSGIALLILLLKRTHA